MTGRCTNRPVDARPFLIERGSTVRVRQSLEASACKTALSCCLSIEHADTFRTHLRYARPIATSRDPCVTRSVGALRSTNPLKSGFDRCLSRRGCDPLPAGRGRRRSRSPYPSLRGQSLCVVSSRPAPLCLPPWRIQCMFCLSCALAPPYGQHLLECDFGEKRDRVRVVAWCSHRTEPIAGSEVADDAVRAAERIAPFGIVQRRDTDKQSL
jgi:hypothetical protein